MSAFSLCLDCCDFDWRRRRRTKNPDSRWAHCLKNFSQQNLLILFIIRFYFCFSFVHLINTGFTQCRMKYPSAPNSLKEREQCVIACQTAYSFFNCVLSCKLATRFICLCRHDRLTVLQGENTYQYMEAYHSYSRLRALFAKVIMLTLHLPIKHRGHS